MNVQVHAYGTDEIIAALDAKLARLANLAVPLAEATTIIYEATRQHFESAGDGAWPPLAESTVARKASQGMAEPEKALYASGNLFESATSPSGPYSTVTHPTTHSVVMGIDWDEDGWQLPMVLSQGTDTAGRGHHTRIPSRPIWAPTTEVATEVGALLLDWVAA